MLEGNNGFCFAASWIYPQRLWIHKHNVCLHSLFTHPLGSKHHTNEQNTSAKFYLEEQQLPARLTFLPSPPTHTQIALPPSLSPSRTQHIPLPVSVWQPAVQSPYQPVGSPILHVPADAQWLSVEEIQSAKVKGDKQLVMQKEHRLSQVPHVLPTSNDG